MRRAYAPATVRNQAVSWARAVSPNGTRDVLGIWIEPTEGVTFWMQVVTDLRVRGWTSSSRSRWPEGHERGTGRRVSADDTADLHRPF